MNSLKTVALNLLIPFLVALFFASLAYYEARVPKFLISITPYIFYFFTMLVLWVSWHFNRNRFIFIVAPLLLVYLGFELLKSKDATVLFHLFSIMFPLHLLIFLLLKERGLFSIWGVFKLLFIVVEFTIIAYIVKYAYSDVKPFLDIQIFAISMAPLKDIAVVVNVAVLFIIGTLLFFNKFLIYSSSFFVMLIAFFLGMHSIKIPHISEITFLTIEAIVFVVLIRETYRLAFYDELTSLPGRRALIEDMAKLGRKYSFAMIDIDFFKKFNDTYGHDTGDEVLKMVASKLAEVSGGGKAYRYGGEEFVILFPSKEVDESYVHTDILRQNIASTPFMVRNKKSMKKIFINISSGIVQNSSSDKDPFATMKRADNALYKAKEAGRNQVVKA